MSEVLVAGVGNVFLGDDAFGVEVVRRLAGRPLPAGVEVADFGIRGIDLTYALLDRYDAAVLVDAVVRGGAPGTLYVLEPETAADAPEPMMPHDLDPAKVLAVVRAMNGRCRRILLVGCEPESLGDECEGRMGLSETVASAVDRAVETVESLVTELILESKMDEAPAAVLG